MYTKNRKSYIALVDTAATYNYLSKIALPFCTNTKTAQGPLVKAVNGQTIKPSFQTHISLTPELNNEAQHAHVLDDSKTRLLISIGQLCDDNCIAILSRYNLKMIKNNKNNYK